MNRLESIARKTLHSLAPLLTVFWLIGGCTHVTLISPYDEDTDKGITAIQKSATTLTTQLNVDPVPPYSSLKPSYDAIRTDIASLRLRNEMRPKNVLTVQQIDQCSAVVKDLEDQHKSGTLNQAMVPIVSNKLDQAFGAVLKLELAKKELTP